MLWFFQRGDEFLRIETTHDRGNGTFTLILHRPNGAQETELFTSQDVFEQRLEALERQLTADLWTAKGSALLPTPPAQRPN